MYEYEPVVERAVPSVKSRDGTGGAYDLKGCDTVYMKIFNETLMRLMAAGFFLGLFLHMPMMDNLFIDLTRANPEIVTFFQISSLIGAVAAILGGGE